MVKKSVTIFCSASDLEQKYIDLAKDISHILCSKGYSVVFGASDKGTMKVVAEVFEENNKDVTGITFGHLEGVARKDITKLIVAASLDDRKQELLARGNFLLALPGGVGTLDELVYAIENIKHGLYNGKLLLFNFENFFDGIKLQLSHMANNGFVDQLILDKVIFVEDTDDFTKLIENF